MKRAALAFAAAVGASLAAIAGDPPPGDLERELRVYLVAEHLKLAEKCVADDLVEEARAEYLAILRVDSQNEIAKRMTSGGRTWVLKWDDARHEKFRDYAELRRILGFEASTRYLALGRARKKSGDAAAAKAAFGRALEYDPDFADAHAELGEARVEGQGWFPKAEAEKRAAGLLPIDGKWLPADEVRTRRRRWADAWQADGPHFTVRSNDSEESARLALKDAEDMYAVLVRETAPVFAPPPQMKPMPVYLFATKDDYDAHVKAAHPGGVSSSALGFYANEDRAAHFWKTDGAAWGLRTVVHHECMHQALDAWIAWKNDPTLQPGFWIYEGLARWFESVENRDGKLLVGGPKHPPFLVARDMVRNGKALRLSELVQLTQADMANHYEEAAGATHFFMTAGDAMYREKFLRYCLTVLRGEAKPDSFEKAMGEKPEEFETAWREFLRGLK